jgi:hypothetical protein
VTERTQAERPQPAAEARGGKREARRGLHWQGPRPRPPQLPGRGPPISKNFADLGMIDPSLGGLPLSTWPLQQRPVPIMPGRR